MHAMSPAAKPQDQSAATDRLWQIDAARGVMLILMTLTHVPTRFTSPAGQPFGFVSAAEGFVLLSGFMAGWVYTGRQIKSGVTEMRTAFLRRVLKIYLSQAALLLFLFSFISMLGLTVHQASVTNLVSFYLNHPAEAIAASLLLIYNPPLLDILPMYVLFMLLSPWLLVQGQRGGWWPIVAVSLALWFGTQFGLGQLLYSGVVATTGFNIPLAETGAFDMLAWQLIWVMGLWLGSEYANGRRWTKYPKWLVAASLIIALVGLVWRHWVGQAAFPRHSDLNILFDKWQLGPLRLLNLLSLLLLALRFEPWLTRTLPRLRALEVMGAASLPVFCAHLVIALTVLATLGEASPQRPLGLDLAILVACFAALYGVASLSGRIDRRAARVRSAFSKARAARLEARTVNAEARRSRLSRSRIPRR